MKKQQPEARFRELQRLPNVCSVAFPQSLAQLVPALSGGNPSFRPSVSLLGTLLGVPGCPLTLLLPWCSFPEELRARHLSSLRLLRAFRLWDPFHDSRHITGWRVVVCGGMVLTWGPKGRGLPPSKHLIFGNCASTSDFIKSGKRN